jgi:MOSC domain-containing protein YiiM
MTATATARIASVNVIHALVPNAGAALGRTAIDKRALAGRVHVGPRGLSGDEQHDQSLHDGIERHGGLEQAVYAYAREDADAWATELGYEIPPGRFGENLSTVGLDVNGAILGEVWQIGDDGLVVQVTHPRVPCRTFEVWMNEPHWVKRFTQRGLPGCYLRVVAEGTVGVDDVITVVRRPEHDVTVAEIFMIRRVEADRLARALADPGVSGRMAERIRGDLDARARNPISR